ncbi:hypothetical protein Enr13x_30770 [Stieleria neptunia]|uniref:Four helix bundle protein n=2 Tax=Stieleria neptunia TaxID=2527979 RepID=A0A518HQU6_9BACT|nr:hypothetical protein Enr13x_30770 [Stieleria neptunia]
MALVESIYQCTNTFPSEEKFGLLSQMRRCAVSIPSNIAEGAAKSSAADYSRFLTIAIGSLSELDTQLELSKRLQFLNDAAFESLDSQLGSISRMLIGLRRSIRSKA